MQAAAASSTADRTMIIVWSWGSGGQTVDGAVWPVLGSRQSSDRVVCIDEKVGDRLGDKLKTAVRTYGEKGDVFVFMHRRHGYHQDHINELMAAFGMSKGLKCCFLFGEGGDALYLTRDPRGLLGVSGTFSARKSMESAGELPLSAIADAESQLLKPEHFNYVWSRYLFAFKERIFELKEDFFSVLSPLLTQSGCDAGEIYALLSRPDQRLLLLRLLSFVGRLTKGSRPEEELKVLAAKEGRSLHFDDGCAQLASLYGEAVGEAYRQLCSMIKQDVLAKGNALEFRFLRDRFDALLDAMPGATYA
jgi:hypothetical protein